MKNHNDTIDKELPIIVEISTLLSQKECDWNSVVKLLSSQLKLSSLYITIFNGGNKGNGGNGEDQTIYDSGVMCGAEPLSKELINTITQRGEVYYISNIVESPEFRNRLGAPAEEMDNYEANITISLRGENGIFGALCFRKYMREAILEFDHEVIFLRSIAKLIENSQHLREEYEQEILLIQKQSDTLRSRAENIIKQGAELMIANLNNNNTPLNESHTLTPNKALSTPTPRSGSLETIMNELERQVIEDALTASRGSLNKAAESLQITERIMGLRVSKYSIDVKQFRERNKTKTSARNK